MNIKPSIVTVDEIVAGINRCKTVRINGIPYASLSRIDDMPVPYYSNIIKRIIAAGYVLFGKGMVVRYSEDLYNQNEIITKEYTE